MAETLTGREDHNISLALAAEYTANYRRTISPDEKKGGYFGKDALLELLNQEGCVGFRYYYGIDEKGKKVLVLVGVNSEANDLVDGRLLERSWPCPHCCSVDNPLNSD
ncbi:MAG TPA: hypothetical protein PKN75_07515 [Bacteroidia bacterium]|nr:hypothetical protein [Bacteroidia bacterium]HNU33426.1 hypothetical protein [Bacteroidia bacterium]